MNTSELRNKANETVAALYTQELHPSVREAFVDMFLLGFIDGFNTSVQVGMCEDDPELVLHMLESYNLTCNETRDALLRKEQINKKREI